MYPHHISNVRLRIVHTYALKVLKGMEWCGQSGYLTILVPLIEKITLPKAFGKGGENSL